MEAYLREFVLQMKKPCGKGQGGIWGIRILGLRQIRIRIGKRIPIKAEPDYDPGSSASPR